MRLVRDHYRVHIVLCVLLGTMIALLRLGILWSALLYQWRGRGSLLFVPLLPLLCPEIWLPFFVGPSEWTIAVAVAFSFVLVLGTIAMTSMVYAVVALPYVLRRGA